MTHVIRTHLGTNDVLWPDRCTCYCYGQAGCIAVLAAAPTRIIYNLLGCQL